MRTDANTRRRVVPATLALPSACLGLLVMASPVGAALGGDVASVQSDQARMQGKVRIKKAGDYTVHEIQTPAGLIIREYVTAAGKVFGVTWRGPLLPDLRQVLGTYFDQYRQARQDAGVHPGHRRLAIRQPGLVVVSGGHMRAFFGKAYVPGMLPQGVRAQDLR